MLQTVHKSLLCTLAAGLFWVVTSGCQPKPQPRPYSPSEQGDGSPKTPEKTPDGGAAPDPATELAPSAPPEAAAPAEAPAPECGKPKDCKVKGKPGKGMQWSCFETRCMAEPKGGLKKSKKGKRSKKK